MASIEPNSRQLEVAQILGRLYADRDELLERCRSEGLSYDEVIGPWREFVESQGFDVRQALDTQTHARQLIAAAYVDLVEKKVGVPDAA